MTIEELFRSNYSLYAKKYAMKTGSVMDAEDIVQEAFTRALSYWSSFDPDKNELSTWFSTILHNVWRDYQRDKRDNGVVKSLEDETEEVGYSIVLEQDKTLIFKLLDTKQGVRKEVLRLHYILGYTPREIVQVTDLASKTVRNYLTQFRKEVEEMFN
jgi:RNA polymerase sigma factor (sigma-70 family)